VPSKCLIQIILTSDLAPEVEGGVAGRQVVSECLKSEVKLSALLNVEGAAVGLNVFELG
jgi:hypothetical protein